MRITALFAAPMAAFPALLQAATPALLAAALPALLMAAPGAQAAPDPQPLMAAGPQPSGERARQAVIDNLKRTVREPADLLRVRFLSGPHLVTGITFADSREQAWQMCVIQGDARISRRSPDVEVKQYFLRTQDGAVRVVPNVNWKTYDNRC